MPLASYDEAEANSVPMKIPNDLTAEELEKFKTAKISYEITEEGFRFPRIGTKKVDNIKISNGRATYTRAETKKSEPTWDSPEHWRHKTKLRRVK